MNLHPERLVRWAVGLAFAAASTALWWPVPGIGVQAAVRIMDVANVQGARSNQLIGYGLVVGLDGTGDQTTQTPFTTQSVNSMLQQLGVTLPPGTSMQLRNVAAVLVTAQLPAFSKPGQTLEVTVSSVGNAKSLKGGTLIATPLKGADGNVYAMAQGNLVVGGAGASANGSKVQINHLSAGRIPDGASVERSVASPVFDTALAQLDLKETDYAMARAVAGAINAAKGDGTAMAVDGRTVSLRMPQAQQDRVGFLADVHGLALEMEKPAARIVLNARTGSVVINETVTLGACAVAHGSLTVTVTTTPLVSQPNAFAQGQTVQANRSDITVNQQGSALIHLPAGAQLAEVVKALNMLGATPQDLHAILQAMKSAGALRADIEVI
ncbi:MAG: flagellar basal body P-ring protein FlgI [Betaproteobacteria bacterium]|nr:flagellar basal body P-ring protein FlgI [Betaproteobacteria bacterium]